MKYSSKQISKAGEIITTSSDLIAVAEAVSKVNEWREQLACHLTNPVF